MTAVFSLKMLTLLAPFTFALATLMAISSWQYQGVLARVPSSREQIALNSNDVADPILPSLARSRNDSSSGLPSTIDALLDAINVMQEKYFSIDTGTWPTSIDWTAAVLGTHISATLSTLISSIDSCSSTSTSTSCTTCPETLAWSNLISRYFAHTSIFYFGENALSLRQQAYDDMLWVVLGWLENIKLMDLYTFIRAKDQSTNQGNIVLSQQSWHGTQFKPPAAHRARIFYDLATHGWDTSLCDGGMVWNPHLRPYKNSITNELFISASVSMYLYFPGDDNDSPFFLSSTSQTNRTMYPHDSRHLENAIKAYTWLKQSNMTNPLNPGLYADGFHISGWHRDPDGRINPGTGKCDELNTMVYTYNQGVVLTGLRGLWIATANQTYLQDGHKLIEAVMQATGWQPDNIPSGEWKGLGRGGVLEEYCDSRGDCSQNGHTFKGIFFHHLAEFCRPLWGVEEGFLSTYRPQGGSDKKAWEDHMNACKAYQPWIEHNAHAALVTRDEEGRFGMWWGRTNPYPPESGDLEKLEQPPLPLGGVDYQNEGTALGPVGPGRKHPGDEEVIVERISGEARADRAAGDVNDRGRGRTVETQSGGLAVLRALWQWEGVSGQKSTGKQVHGLQWGNEL
jgi:Glycosyl hydrolase family 76